MSTLRNHFLFASLLIPLLACIPRALAQRTNATCQPGFEWSSNSRGQSTCLIAAYLISPCRTDPTDPFVVSLGPGWHYSTPWIDSATPCNCNTVYYSLLQACAVCQGNSPVPWSTWQTNCSLTVGDFLSVYPETIPSGTSIPAWAYLDVTKPDTVNVTAAEALAKQGVPESTAGSSPQSTISAGISSSSLFESPSSLPTLTDAPAHTGHSVSGNSSSNNKPSIVGPVVGGVIGGIVLLGISVGFAAYLVIRNRGQSGLAAPNLFNLDAPPLFQQFYQDYPDKTAGMSDTSTAVPSTYATAPTPKLYNPDDPSTFPATSPEPSFTLHSGQPQNTTAYSGIPEL